MKNRALPAAIADSRAAARANRLLLSGALILAFASLTAAGAHVRIPLPFTPVPLTLQTFFVLLAGALLGARRGLLSQAAYVGLGMIGLPVFALGSAALLGPTGGYLVGFIAAAALVGLVAGRDRAPSFPRTAGAMALGLAVLYFFGALQLAILGHLGTREAISMGILPFLLGDAVKLAAAAGIATALRSRLSR